MTGFFKKNNISPYRLVLFLFLIILFFGGFGCKLQDEKTKEATKPVELTYWRVWDSEKDFRELIDSYKAIHPNVTISYRSIQFEEIEQKLLEAMAEDRGPDMFSLHSSWIPEYRNRIYPLPKTTSMAYQRVQKSLGLKEEIVVEYKTTPSITPEKIKNDFVGPVYDEVVYDGKVYGLPLSVDTLAMYYNVDLLNNAGFAEPADSWAKLQQQTPELTRQNKEGKIIQSAVALGASSNVERYFDILSLLMMQNGTKMMSDGLTSVMFEENPPTRQGGETPPGEDAVRFYTEFADPAKSVYTWNKDMENSLDAFIRGKVAYFFGYSYHQPAIRARAPKLNFGIASMLQISGDAPTNYANYWVETVSKKSKYKDAAWDFIQYIVKEENVEKYLKSVQKPTALRGLYEKQKKDLAIGIFTEQILTSKNWYRGMDVVTTERAFKEMIDDTIGAEKLEDIIRKAAQKVQQTL